MPNIYNATVIALSPVVITELYSTLGIIMRDMQRYVRSAPCVEVRVFE